MPRATVLFPRRNSDEKATPTGASEILGQKAWTCHGCAEPMGMEAMATKELDGKLYIYHGRCL